MKVGPKSSLRSVLHRALQLSYYGRDVAETENKTQTQTKHRRNI